MTHKIKLKNKSQIFLLTVILSLSAGQVSASDNYHNHRHSGKKQCHKKHHDNDYNDHRRGRGHYSSSGQGQCRKIVQEFDISRHVTYTESGLLCRNGYGAWQVVTPTKFPFYFGRVYFVDNGRKEFFGEVAPRQNSYEQGFDRNEYEDSEPEYDYADKKQHNYH